MLPGKLFPYEFHAEILLSIVKWLYKLMTQVSAKCLVRRLTEINNKICICTNDRGKCINNSICRVDNHRVINVINMVIHISRAFWCGKVLKIHL